MGTNNSGNTCAFSNRAVVSAVAGVGAVYLYEYDGTTWNFIQSMIVSDAEEAGQFQSVALSNDTVFIGAPTGTMYVFRNDGYSWVQKRKFKAWMRSMAINSGAVIALQGDLALIGAAGALGPHQPGIQAQRTLLTSIRKPIATSMALRTPVTSATARAPMSTPTEYPMTANHRSACPCIGCWRRGS